MRRPVAAGGGLWNCRPSAACEHKFGAPALIRTKLIRFELSGRWNFLGARQEVCANM